MTKAPRAGKVKTRLQPPLTAEEAAALNICFLRDTAAAIARASGQCAHGVGVYTPRGAEADYSGILPGDFFLLPQRGDGFGERLCLAVDDLLRCGFSSVCLIDSDSPTVPAENFVRAVTSLRDRPETVVLGPSDDGGYYLIGMTHLRPEVFQDIDWSTERVLDQTCARARKANIPVELLPASYDVDDAHTLTRLCNELLGGNDETAPATRAFLEQIIAREGTGRICPNAREICA